MSQDTTRGYETTVYGVESNDDEIFFRKNADVERKQQRHTPSRTEEILHIFGFVLLL